MQIKEYIACVAFSVVGLFHAQAQDILPETLPQPLKAEKIVIEANPVQSVEIETQVKEKEMSYNASFGESVVKTALQYLGARYASGGVGPYSFDCSGFTSFIYKKANVPILRSSRSQFTQGTPIARISDLKKGDLVFFAGRGSRHSVGHVGIVTEVDPTGNNFSFVHAASGGVKVSESNEPYYSRRYMGARRIVKN